MPIEAADLRFLVDFGQRLYTVIKQAAAAANGGVGEVPASSAFMFHPNAAGMKAQANMLVKRLRSQS